MAESLPKTRVHDLQCAACGWNERVGEVVGDVRDDPGSIARTLARHLGACPQRFLAHPAFGQSARWFTELVYPEKLKPAQTRVLVTWNAGGYGNPFDLTAALAEKENT